MSVGAGSIKRATASAKPAETPVETKESVAAAAQTKSAQTAVSESGKPAAKKPAASPKTAAAKKPAAPRKTTTAKKPASPKAAVITGANPDIEFYRISEDLPIHLL